MFARALDAVMASGEYDMAYCNVGLIAGLPFIRQPLVDSLTDSAARFPTVPMAMSVTAAPDIVAQYTAAGYLCYREPARAIKALAALATFPTAWTRPLPLADDLAGQPQIAAGSKFSEAKCKALLAQIGIVSPADYLVTDVAGAIDAAAAIGGPIAMKVVSPEILHKTEIGGVALNVVPHDVAACFTAMQARVTAALPQAQIDGYLVSPMITGGVECILGVHTDPLLGPVIMFGLGGVTVELLKDVTTRLAPVDEGEAMAMIRAVRSAPLLQGFRGRPTADIDALASAISALSRLAAANAGTVRTIEVNPLLVRDAGCGVLALDAVIET